MFLTHRGTSKDSHDPLECLGVRGEDGEVWIQAVRGVHGPPYSPFHPSIYISSTCPSAKGVLTRVTDPG